MLESQSIASCGFNFGDKMTSVTELENINLWFSISWFSKIDLWGTDHRPHHLPTQGLQPVFAKTKLRALSSPGSEKLT